MTSTQQIAARPNPEDFPLLNECVAQGDAWALFPLMKNWDRAKLDALMTEIDKAEELTQVTWEREAFKPVNFFFNSTGLDKAKFDALCMLSEIASVAIHYMEQINRQERGRFDDEHLGGRP